MAERTNHLKPAEPHGVYSARLDYGHAKEALEHAEIEGATKRELEMRADSVTAARSELAALLPRFQKKLAL